MQPSPLVLESSAADHGGRPAQIVVVRGEIDMSTAEQLGGFLDALVVAGTALIVLDTAEVSFLDSTGLRVLVDIGGRLEAAGGKLVVEGMSGSVRRVLEVTGLLERYRAVD